MKRTPLIFAAMAPFVATAALGAGQDKLDYTELRDDVQVTTILGSDVQGANGEEMGSVEDVMIGSDGKVSVIIQREGDFEASDISESVESGAEQTGQAIERGAEETGEAVDRGMDRTRESAERISEDEDNYEEYQETTADDDEDFGEVGGTDVAGNVDDESMDQGLDVDRAGSTEMGDEFVKVEWSAIQYDPNEESVRLSDMQSAQPVAYEQTADIDMQGNARASMLIGMEVNLADEDSFGEVEDVLVDPATGKASALVIDSMEFFDKERYAVPVNLDAVNAEEEEITLQYTEQQLEDMGEFDMEAATNEEG